MSQPIVTVIVTVFNRVDYLEEAVKSVLRQTFTAFELLVTDDANQHLTRAICARFASDGRIRYRANSKTLGIPLNVAAALREARGEYICILNDDDCLDPEFLTWLVPPMEANPTITAAFCDYRVIDATGVFLPKESRVHMENRNRIGLPHGLLPNAFRFLLRAGLMVVMGCVFRREKCDASWLVPEVVGAYDYWLAVNLARSGGGVFHVSKTLMSYRTHGNSETARISPDKLLAEVYIYNSLREFVLDHADARYVHHQLAFYLYLLGRDRVLHSSQMSVARQALVRSLRLAPKLVPALVWLTTFFPHRLRNAIVRRWLRWRNPQSFFLNHALR